MLSHRALVLPKSGLLERVGVVDRCCGEKAAFPDALRSAAVTLRAFVAGEVSVVVSFVGVWRPVFLSWWSVVL